MLKPGGLMMLGVPTFGRPYAKDVLAWNNHRIYGKARVPQMAANYDFVEVIKYGGGKIGKKELEAPEGVGTFFVMRKPLAGSSSGVA